MNAKKIIKDFLREEYEEFGIDVYDVYVDARAGELMELLNPYKEKWEVL